MALNTLSVRANRRYITQHAFAVKSANVPLGRCKQVLHNSRFPSYSCLLIVTVLSRSALIAADTVVLCITWHRTYETLKNSRLDAAHTSRKTFANTLLRDGVYLHSVCSSL